MPLLHNGKETEYTISNTGKVFSLKTNKMLKLNPNKKGYLRVGIYLSDGTIKRISVHKAVLESFGKSKPGKDYQIDHIDGNKLNNNINNLEWVTASENINRAFKNGLKVAKRGEEHPISVYSENQIHEACRLLTTGYSFTKTSDISGIPKSYLYNIVKGNNWNHIVKDYNLGNVYSKTKMTDNIKNDIEYYLGLKYKKSDIIKIINKKYSINSKHLVYNYNRKK